MSTLTRIFTSAALQQAHDEARLTEPSVLGWRLDDGAEVLRVGTRLLVAVHGVFLEREDIPVDVPVSWLVAQMRRTT